MPTAAQTNWIRLSGPINTFTFHFASRDWKVLSNLDDSAAEDWLDAFGFVGHGPEFSVARGLQIGYEVTGRRSAMLHSTQLLLPRLTKEAELLIYDYSVTLFVARYNFCRPHMPLNTTPAVAAGLVSETWSVERLWSESAKGAPA